VTRLLHVNVIVPVGRTDIVAPFYELLGLTRVEKPTEGVAQVGAWFDFPDGITQVHVSERGGSPNPDQHFAMSVADLDAMVVRLEAAGHPWKPGSVVFGARRGMTRDPEGNAVELIESVGPFA
jgi:catechol 2,3-dioxygenase-like lactoylglutathione lyase family enzyme